MPHDRHRRSQSPPSRRRHRHERRDSDEDDEEIKKRRRMERLEQWKKKQQQQEESAKTDAEPEAKDTEEVDALDAFMDAEVMPEISASVRELNAKREKEKNEKAKILAAGKTIKKPKVLDSDSEDDANLEMDVPTSRVKLIIGPGGTRIQEIQKRSKCRVQVQKKEAELNRAFGSGPNPSHPRRRAPSVGTTRISIYGDPKGVACAKRLIEEAIENKEQKRQQRQREYEKKRASKIRDRQIYHLRHARDYETLGLPLGASKVEAKKAYRKLAVQWHPDKYTGNDKEFAQKKFLEIQQAYQNLMSTDEDQRVEQLAR
eukprot:g2955.t1